MLVKLSVKTFAVLEEWILLALSVQMSSVRTKQLLRIERKHVAFPS